MGCDIHLICQVKKGEAWRTVHQATGSRNDKYPALENRNYEAFAQLADVRNRGEPVIDMPRGLPRDVERAMAKESDNGDFEKFEGFWMGDHSFSWLSYREMLDWDKWGYWMDEFAEALKTIFEGHDPEDCRIVFGFDN